MALDGHRLMGGYNNQLKVAVDGGGVGREETFVQSGELKGNIKIKNKIGRGLRWLPTGKSNTTTNQKHA